MGREPRAGVTDSFRQNIAKRPSGSAPAGIGHLARVAVATIPDSFPKRCAWIARGNPGAPARYRAEGKASGGSLPYAAGHPIGHPDRPRNLGFSWKRPGNAGITVHTHTADACAVARRWRPHCRRNRLPDIPPQRRLRATCRGQQGNLATKTLFTKKEPLVQSGEGMGGRRRSTHPAVICRRNGGRLLLGDRKADSRVVPLFSVPAPSEEEWPVGNAPQDRLKASAKGMSALGPGTLWR